MKKLFKSWLIKQNLRFSPVECAWRFAFGARFYAEKKKSVAIGPASCGREAVRTQELSSDVDASPFLGLASLHKEFMERLAAPGLDAS